jgi:hypothetical protein
MGPLTLVVAPTSREQLKRRCGPQPERAQEKVRDESFDVYAHTAGHL